MKRLAIALLFTFAATLAAAQLAPGKLRVQSAAAARIATTTTRGALPTSTTQTVTLTWQQGCPAAENCLFDVYQCIQTTGACSLSDTADWLLLNSAPLAALSFTDTTVGAGGQAYSYFVFATANGLFSAPANEVTMNVPLLPGAPAGVTGSVP